MKLTLPKCKFCGREFLPKTSWQVSCKSPECERRRVNENQRRYDRKKKEKTR